VSTGRIVTSVLQTMWKEPIVTQFKVLSQPLRRQTERNQEKQPGESLSMPRFERGNSRAPLDPSCGISNFLHGFTGPFPLGKQ
jgi:hypothetical protein